MFLAIGVSGISDALAADEPEIAYFFYLNNQNGDHVDSYARNVEAKVNYFSQLYKKRKAAFLTIINEGLTRELAGQRLAIKSHVNGISNDLKSLPGASFSSPSSLVQFLETGLQVGAKRNVLILVDHGFGDEGIMSTELLVNGKAEVAVLSNADLAAGIKAAESVSKKSVDLIICDACLMGSIEAVSDLSAAGISASLVASENTTLPTNGGANYAKFFETVYPAGGGTTAEFSTLGELFVNANRENLAANFALIDIQKFKELKIIEQFNAISPEMVKLLKKIPAGEFLAALNGVRPTAVVRGGVYDVQAVLDVMKRKAGTRSSLGTKISSLQKSLREVIRAKELDRLDSQESGISIKLFSGGRNPEAAENSLSKYRILPFSKGTGWGQVVELFSEQITEGRSIHAKTKYDCNSLLKPVPGK